MLKRISKAVTRTLQTPIKQGFKSTMCLNSELARFNDSFLAGCNAEFVENLFEKWVENPSSVAASWDIYFKNLVRGVEPEYAFSQAPTDTSRPMHIAPDHAMKFAVSNNMKARLMIDAFRMRGHEIADLDPLCTYFQPSNQPTIPDYFLPQLSNQPTNK